MEILQQSQKLFRIVGIDLKKHLIQKYPFNWRSITTALVFGLGILTSAIYTLFLAITFEEFITSFCALTTFFQLFLNYEIVFWRNSKLTKFFAQSQTSTEKCKNTFDLYGNVKL